MPRFNPDEPFVPATGLANAHAQTIFANSARSTSGVHLTRERLETPDGDFVDLDHLTGTPGAPRVLVLHGLEGSSRSSYVRELLRGVARRGWHATALNFRSCSGVPNRAARSYHSGETGDVLFVLEHLRARDPRPVLGVGFSLGGSVLLRLLIDGEADAPLAAAAAVSTPYDLSGCATALDGPGAFAWLYRTRFLRTLKEKSLRKARMHPGSVDVVRLQAAMKLRAFDDAVTAPLHGFVDAADYYRRCSAGPGLDRIARPTLLLSATDDPFVPGVTLPPVDESSRYLHWMRTEHGGHVGFVAGSPLRPRYWAERQVLRFFDEQLGSSRADAAR